VSSGVLFHLYLADVSVPLLGTSFVETPQISGGRSIVHFILFLLCFYKLASTFSIECRLRVVTQAGSGCSNQLLAHLKRWRAPDSACYSASEALMPLLPQARLHCPILLDHTGMRVSNYLSVAI
jgi:hypothetical protein